MAGAIHDGTTRQVDDVVIGGGFSGLYAAQRLARQGRRVAVIEYAPVLGGIMRSSIVPVAEGIGLSFDIGTHYLLLTGDDTVDRPLLDAIEPDAWQWFEHSLPEGHFYDGKLQQETGCLDVSQAVDVGRYRAEYFACDGGGESATTLQERWHRDFGPSLSEGVLAPIARKHLGRDINEVAPTAMEVFVQPRVKLFDRGDARNLKRDPKHDRRIAFGRRSDGSSSIRKAYPYEGGVGRLVDGMIADLTERGVLLLSGVRLSGPERGGDGRSINFFRVAGSDVCTSIACERIVSTLAPMPLARILGVEIPNAPFAARDLHLVYFRVKGGALNESQLHWITVFDPALRISRVTLHDNIVPKATGRLMVEASAGPADDLASFAATAEQELVRMGLVGDTRDLEFVACHVERGAFPILLPGWKPRMEAQAQSLVASVPNLVAAGAAAGTPFGQLALLRDIAQRVG